MFPVDSCELLGEMVSTALMMVVKVLNNISKKKEKKVLRNYVQLLEFFCVFCFQ